MPVLFKVVKNNNRNITDCYGKYYARPVVTDTIGIAELAEHLASHNTPFSAGAVRGILTDMVLCIKELVMQNIAVKIDNLCIFSIGIRPKVGADTEKSFSVAKNVEGLRLRARATGFFTNEQLDLNATLKNAATLFGDDNVPGGNGGGSSEAGDNGGGTDAGGTGGGTDAGGGSSDAGGGSSDAGGGSSDAGGAGSNPGGESSGGEDMDL